MFLFQRNIIDFLFVKKTLTIDRLF